MSSRTSSQNGKGSVAEELRKRVKAGAGPKAKANPNPPPRKDASAEPVSPPRLSVRPLSDFKIQPVEYLVPDLIPIGALTLLVADGGMGKSTVLSTLVSQLSRGLPAWGLEYDPQGGPIESLIIQAEEDVESS